MAWRVAKSLIKLRDQVDAAYPGRNKASDGTIGDPAHQAEGTGSDHNPNKNGVVCALDITHDPAHGVDIDKLSDALAASRDPRIKYLIANSLIMVPADYGWKWVQYNGSNPHTSHLHVSVYGDYDNTAVWNIGKKGAGVNNEEAKKLGTEYYRFGLHREPENVASAVHQGKGFLDKSGNLTPRSVADQLYRARREKEWIAKDTLLKQAPTLQKQVADLQAKLKAAPADTSEAEKELNNFRDALEAILDKE